MDPWYKLQSTDQFSEGVLPTKRAVLQRLLHEQNWHGKNPALTLSKELFKGWVQSNAYPISQKVFDLAYAFKQTERCPSFKKGAAFRKRVEDCINDIDDLYNAFNPNEQNCKKLEKKYKLRMNKSAWNFYHDQCLQESQNVMRIYSF